MPATNKVRHQKQALLQVVFAAVLLLGSVEATAVTESGGVVLLLQDDAACAEKDGKLVVLENTGATPQTVWVDRWFMDVKTPDHTRHALAPAEKHALGCSMTRAGEQHWTIDSGVL